MPKARILTQQELDNMRECLSYDPETGLITWLVGKQGNKGKGSEAGNVNKSTGYIDIKLNKRTYKSHRIAWYLHFNEWPSDQIDHVKGDRLDNRINQLRLVTHQENNKNKKIQSNNTSGITGVYWNKSRNKWCVMISIKGKQTYLGYYDDFFEACCTRKSSEIENGFHPNHGRD